MQHKIEHKMKKVAYYVTLLEEYKDDCKRRLEVPYIVICEEALEKLEDIKIYLSYIQIKLD